MWKIKVSGPTFSGGHINATANPSIAAGTGGGLKVLIEPGTPIDSTIDAAQSRLRVELAQLAEQRLGELEAFSALATVDRKLAAARDQAERLKNAITGVAAGLLDLESNPPDNAAAQILALENSKAKLDQEMSIANRLVNSLVATKDRLEREIRPHRSTITKSIQKELLAELLKRQAELCEALVAEQSPTLAELAEVTAQLASF